MEVKAQLNQLRMAPRKARLVANLISGMDVAAAKIQLELTTKKASDPILKLLNSAIANAKNNHKLEESNLYVSKILVNGGTVMKRWFPRAMGRAFPIKKRTCSIILTLSERNEVLKPEENRKKKAGKEQKETDNAAKNAAKEEKPKKKHKEAAKGDKGDKSTKKSVAKKEKK